MAIEGQDKKKNVTVWGAGDAPMPRYQAGDRVLFRFDRYDLLRLQSKTGCPQSPTFEVLRVLPAGEDGIPAYQVKCPLEPYGRVVKEHELSPV